MTAVKATIAISYKLIAASNSIIPAFRPVELWGLDTHVANASLSVARFCRLVKIAVVTWFLFSRTVCVSLLGWPIKKRAGRSRVAARFAR